MFTTRHRNPGQGGAVSVGPIWHAYIAICPTKHRREGDWGDMCYVTIFIKESDEAYSTDELCKTYLIVSALFKSSRTCPDTHNITIHIINNIKNREAVKIPLSVPCVKFIYTA